MTLRALWRHYRPHSSTLSMLRPPVRRRRLDTTVAATSCLSHVTERIRSCRQPVQRPAQDIAPEVPVMCLHLRKLHSRS